MVTFHNKPARANSRSNVTISRQQTQKTLVNNQRGKGGIVLVFLCAVKREDELRSIDWLSWLERAAIEKVV